MSDISDITPTWIERELDKVTVERDKYKQGLQELREFSIEAVNGGDIREITDKYLSPLKVKEIKAIDKNFAPKGFIAVPDNSKPGCLGCAFEASIRCGNDRRCCMDERPDGRRVMFIPIPVEEMKEKHDME